MLDDEWWWCRGEMLQAISRSLAGSYVAVVDDFLPANEIHSVTDEVRSYTANYSSYVVQELTVIDDMHRMIQVYSAYKNGLLSKHGAIGTGDVAIKDSSIRGDLYGFYGRDDDWKPSQGGPNCLERLLDKMVRLYCSNDSS